MDDQALLRYSRQIMLPEIDIEGQQRLAQSRALIIGLGGLGSPIALYLGAAGVGQLVLVDDDAVELSNLQRQIAHGVADLDRLKVESAAESVAALNPLVAVETIPRRLSDDPAALAEQVSNADVVLDASDNLATRLAVNAACVAAQTPLVSGAAIRLEGQVMVVRPDQPEAPCYRCLFRSEQEIDESCSQSGVLAPLLGIIGSIQAVEAIKLLVGGGDTLSGRLLLLDAWRMDWQTVRVPRNPRCPVCGRGRGSAAATA